MSRHSPLADELLDARQMEAPMLPGHRPPTKREVWARYSFIYEGIKDQAKLIPYCRDGWTWWFVYWFNFKGWRKHPGWVDGEPVIHQAVPAAPFTPDWGACTREVERLYQIAEAAKAAERRAA